MSHPKGPERLNGRPLPSTPSAAAAAVPRSVWWHLPGPPPAQLPHRSAPGLPRALRVRHTHKRAAVSDQVTLEVTAATPLPWNLKPREPSLPEATSQ